MQHEQPHKCVCMAPGIVDRTHSSVRIETILCVNLSVIMLLVMCAMQRRSLGCTLGKLLVVSWAAVRVSDA
jgi:hypothetical protein